MPVAFTSIALLSGTGSSWTPSRSHALLDLVDDPLGLLLAAVGHQPARALGDGAAKVDDDQTGDRADEEADAASRG